MCSLAVTEVGRLLVWQSTCRLITFEFTFQYFTLRLRLFQAHVIFHCKILFYRGTENTK